MNGVFPALQATNAFSVTPSDTLDVKSDPNNADQFPLVFLHNPGTGATVRVLAAGQAAGVANANAVTVYIAQGATLPLAVRRIYATTPTTAAGAFIAFVGKQR